MSALTEACRRGTLAATVSGRCYGPLPQESVQPTDHTAEQTPCREEGLVGQFYMVNGGQPLVLNGVIVGAVGVAGLGPGQDDQAIDAGVAAWQSYRAQVGR